MQAIVILDHVRRLPQQLIQTVRVRLKASELEQLDELIATLKPPPPEQSKPTTSKTLKPTLPEPSKPTTSKTLQPTLPTPPKPSRAPARAKSSPPSARTGKLLSFLNDDPFESDFEGDVFVDEAFEADVFGEEFEESQESQLDTWRSAIREHGRSGGTMVACPICGNLVFTIVSCTFVWELSFEI